jgi:tape measure domain-containing protein
MTFNAGSATSTASINIGPFRQGILEAQSIASIFPQTITNFIANPLLGVVGAAKEAGMAIASALTGSLGSGLKLAADAEQAQVAFEVMLGSAEKAKTMLTDMTKYAAETPFQIPEIVNTGRMLLGFGKDVDTILPSIRMIGDIASGTSQPLKDLGLIYSQVFAKTKLQGEELLQLAERGVPVRRELEKLTGTSGAAFDKMVSDGKVSFALFDQALQNLTSAGGQFEGMSARQSQTLRGLFSTMQDAKDGVLRNLGEGFASGLDLKSIIAGASDSLSGLNDLAKTFGNDLGAALRPIMQDTLGWIRTHPDEAKQKVSAAAAAIVSAVGGIVSAGQMLLPIAASLLANLDKVVAGGGVLMLVKQVSQLTNAFSGLAGSANVGGMAAAAAIRAATGSGGSAGVGGIGLGIAGAAAGIAATDGSGMGGVVGAGVGGFVGQWAGGAIGGAIGGLLLPGVGVIPGALIGRLIGGAAGGWLGQGIGDTIDKRPQQAMQGSVTINVRAGDTPEQIAQQVSELSGESYRQFVRAQYEAQLMQSRVAEGL